MQFARESSNRVLFFDEGLVLENAPLAEMFTKPCHQRTRDFLKSVLEAR